MNSAINGFKTFNQELASSSTLTYKEVQKHLEISTNTFIIELLRPFYKNPRTEILKTPKSYFLDNGFRNYLLSDFKEVRQEKRHRTISGKFCKINFWRIKSKTEVDFVIQENKAIVPIEVKYSRSPSPGKSFRNFLEKFSPKQGSILTQDFSDIRRIGKTKVYFAPVYCL